MRSFLLFNLLLFVLSVLSPVSAETYFHDLPKGHWAEDSVYDLVRRGVIGGFPDGTFRGKRKMTRYEIASFLSKLAKSFSLKHGMDEKVLAEIDAEIEGIKYDRAQQENKLKIFGDLESRMRTTTAPVRGAQFDYRLKSSLSEKIYDEAGVAIDFDTMDAGYANAVSRSIAAEMVAVQGWFKLGNLQCRGAVGPGTLLHTESGNLFPSDNFSMFTRPKSALEAAGTLGKLALSAVCVNRQALTSSNVRVNEIAAKAEYSFGNSKLIFRPRYIAEGDGSRNMLMEGGLNVATSENVESGVMFSAAAPQYGLSGCFAKAYFGLKKLFRVGPSAALSFKRAGSRYRIDDLDEYEFVDLNNFDRCMVNGTSDFGWKISQEIFEKMVLEWKGDYVTAGDYKYGEDYPGTYLLWQLSARLSCSPHAMIEGYYRAFEVPSGIDRFIINKAVPKFSNIAAIVLKLEY